MKEAINGELAVEEHNRMKTKGCCEEFKIIMMDCEMPVMNGWEATKELRKIGCTSPIIGYTAYSGFSDLQKCLDSGMNQVLNKPSPPNLILKTINNFIHW